MKTVKILRLKHWDRIPEEGQLIGIGSIGVPVRLWRNLDAETKIHNVEKEIGLDMIYYNYFNTLL